MKSVIIIKNQDYKIPQGYLDLAQKLYTSFLGCAAIDENKLATSSLSIRDGVIEPTGINDTQNAISGPIVYTLGLMDHPPLEQDEQPFILLRTNAGDALVAGFLSGDFVGVGKPDSSATMAAQTAEDYLTPELELLYDACGQSLSKLIENLRTPLWKRKMGMILKPGDAIALMLADGSIHTFRDNVGQYTDYPWGWVSNHLGYNETTKTSESVAVKSKLSLGSKKTEASVPVIPPEGLPQATATSIPPKFIIIGPPEDLKDSHKIEKWYQSHIGYKPPKWREKPKVRIESETEYRYLKNQSKIKSFGEMVEYLKKNGTYAEGASHVPAEAPVTGLSAMPVIPPEQKKNIIEKFLKAKTRVVDSNSKEIPTPENMMDDIKLPTFCESAGIEGGLREICRWGFESLVELRSNYPQASDVLLFDVLRNYAKLFDVEMSRVTTPPVTEPERLQAPQPKKLSLKSG